VKVIRLAEDTISQEELLSAADFLTSGRRLTKGELTWQFEQDFSSKVGSKHAVFVNSGSSANLLVAAALKESGRLKNQVVVCPAISWVTTVTPFMQLGFDVILCDSEAGSLGLDPVALERIFQTSEPALLVIVNVLGHPNQMDKISMLCPEIWSDFGRRFVRGFRHYDRRR
jgi:CDP-6-deoxy-D-xylo-4-hexulose-3-dehydrase